MVTLIGLVIAVFNRVLVRALRFTALTLKLRLFSVLTISVLGAALLIPIRGGLQQTPMNQSGVYFSTYSFANHAAINATWNFMQGVLAFKDIARNPYQYLSQEAAKVIVDSLYSTSQKREQVLNTTSPNIILIIWESFTEKALNRAVGGMEVLPHFNALRKEGMYFSNVYASGDRTDKGLGAILSAYPALPSTSILRDVNKAAQLPFLSNVFQDKGYVTPFYYGGEPEFANIKSYLLNGKFSPIIEKKDFAAKDQNSKWGAHDGVVAKRMIADLQKMKQPFMTTWLTLTSHEPFETPEAPVFGGDDQATRFLNSMHYTDKVIGDFVSFCKQQNWWKNTLIVIIADHGHPLPETGKKDENFRIPMLWLGGALRAAPRVMNEITSQLDLAPTLAAQVGLEKKFPFGKNIFDSTAKKWAFFTFNDGWGFVNGSGTMVYDNVGKQVIRVAGVSDSLATRAGQALQQYFYQDYLDR
jgi:phosphoglycerol transferase MdoB-like AlkP superfamily enzyme